MAKLFVIAGHGAGDPGACSAGYSEADLVRRLASRLKAFGGSDVTVGDTSVNWYASNYISKGKCPKGVPVIELHMDSASASAKGGHVIIKAGLSADRYDVALANFIGGFFPGRAKTIVGRSDLANPNRAQNMGLNYRLVECGFISNSGDLTKFINRMDDLAKGILNAFDIGVASSKPAEPVVEEEPKKPLPEALAKFTDLDPEGWYINSLAKAVQAGYMRGYNETTMGPNDPLLRGQAVCVIANAAGFDPEHPYSDVVASPYYYDAVEWAKENGIITSDQESFRPNDNCTRSEFVGMLYNWKGEETEYTPIEFKDWSSVPEWAVNAVAWAIEADVVNGSNGLIRPNDFCTRAEAATMLVNLLQ